MDFENRLKKLQSQFTYASSNAATGKVIYLAVLADPTSSPPAVAVAKMNWRQLEVRKTAIIAQMVALEELDMYTV